MKTKGQDEKSLRIFEEKKNKKRKVKTERKLYRSYILSTWISCKKKNYTTNYFIAHCQNKKLFKT